LRRTLSAHYRDIYRGVGLLPFGFAWLCRASTSRDLPVRQHNVAANERTGHVAGAYRRWHENCDNDALATLLRLARGGAFYAPRGSVMVRRFLRVDSAAGWFLPADITPASYAGTNAARIVQPHGGHLRWAYIFSADALHRCAAATNQLWQISHWLPAGATTVLVGWYDLETLRSAHAAEPCGCLFWFRCYTFSGGTVYVYRFVGVAVESRVPHSAVCGYPCRVCRTVA